ncbi:sigma-70 family RNA polymerase sigma factor [Brevibacterium luteolum]|uniref:Sigma-70 family RNA polymerase sigma factor n=1 Tax=Brevibacterium luteolum TaxID=199591 RepID=A0A849AMF4_9MICO|nr:sigma-70 family RNA polymerase sigma factor [Brevibacterium luteolum]MBM7530599.1 RNA polymerase primary sigma factor [Brevibacterium luteolum]NNG77989.1 sigma-70 family RNA polymerase sigma factor [Brevibacterium luteolum]
MTIMDPTPIRRQPSGRLDEIEAVLPRLRTEPAEPHDPFLALVRGRPAREVNPGLWDWQAEALDRWHASDCRGVIEAVTGAGKTMVGITAAYEACRMGVKVLVLVPTIELQEQWFSRLNTTLPDALVGMFGNGRRDSLRDCDIVIAVVHSAARSEQLADHHSGLLIADETHRYAAPSFVRALSERFSYRLGLTATYERPDEAHKHQLDPYFGGVIFRLWYDRALADGVIAPFDLAFVRIDLNAEERSNYERFSSRMSKLERPLRHKLGLVGAPVGKFFTAVSRLAGRKDDPSPAAMMARRYLDAMNRRQSVLSNARSKLRLLEELAPVVAKSDGTLVFADTIDSSTQAGAVLSSAGVKCESISSDSPPETRRGALSRFGHGHAQALCAPRILDEGIDVPRADLAIVVSGSRQARQTIQRLGRVIRRKPNGGRGRFVHVFAARTAEDPFERKSRQYADIEQFADRVGHFTGDEVRSLRRFLLEDRRQMRPPLAEPHSEAEVPPTVETVLVPEPVEAPHAATPEPQAPSPSPTEPGPAEDGAFEIVLRIPDERKVAADELRPQLGGKSLHDSTKLYLIGIGKAPLLTAEDEVALAKTIEAGLYAEHLWQNERYSTRRGRHELEAVVREGREAKEKFVRSNLRLVASIAKSYARHCHHLEFLDLISHGHIGLTRAVDGFDFKRGQKFSTYATWWIRQSINRGIQDEERTIRVPVHVLDRVSEHRRCEDARLCDHDIDLIERVDYMQPRSLDRILDDEKLVGLFAERFSPVDLNTGESQHTLPHPEDEMLLCERNAAVNAVIDQLLGPREADIIRRRFGWSGEPQTLEVIGQAYDVTRERIRQLERDSLKTLREFMTRVPAGDEEDVPAG